MLGMHHLVDLACLLSLDNARSLQELVTVCVSNLTITIFKAVLQGHQAKTDPTLKRPSFPIASCHEYTCSDECRRSNTQPVCIHLVAVEARNTG